MACETLMANPMFEADEINVIGFSMGGLIARFIAQDCPIKGKVRNLVTVGTPNMGITGLPKCGSAETYQGAEDLKSIFKSFGCRLMTVAAKNFIYNENLKDISAISYIRDVDDIDTYL